MLRAENISAGYGGRAIVAEVTLEVAAGEVVALLGHNGAGKSTLLRALFGLLPQARGTVTLDGRALAGLAPRAILAHGLAYVPQERSVFPKLTVAENLRMGAYALADDRALAARIESALALFPRLRERIGQLAGTLSGGEQRMLEVARTLLLDPRAIMLDEPSIGLAPKMADALFATIRALAAQGRAVLLVEQSVKKALACADRAAVMEMGRVVLVDSAAALARDDRVARLYMGAKARPA